MSFWEDNTGPGKAVAHHLEFAPAASRWEQELVAMKEVKFRPAIRFVGCLHLPQSGHVLLEDELWADPQGYIQRWLAGALSVIYSGPLVNYTGPHSGKLIIISKVRVKIFDE